MGMLSRSSNFTREAQANADGCPYDGVDKIDHLLLYRRRRGEVSHDIKTALRTQLTKI